MSGGGSAELGRILAAEILPAIIGFWLGSKIGKKFFRKKKTKSPDSSQPKRYEM